MKQEIILLMKFIPAPAYSGGAKRNLSWLKFLSKYYKVNLIGFFDKKYNNSKISDLKKYNINIYGFTFKRNIIKNSLKSIIFHKSLINLQYYDKNIKTLLNNMLQSNNISFIMCEELAMMNYCMNLNVPIYFDDHNIEYILMNRTANYNSLPLKLFLKREAKLIKKEELKSFKKAKKIFVVSDTDKQQINNKYSNKTIVVNNCYEILKKPILQDLQKNIVFVGNVSWKPNLHGVKHFIRNIFPKVLQKENDITLHIIGSNIPKQIKQITNPNIILHENASEIEKNKIIDESRICIVPVYFGSGTRIKILEYWSHYKPVISTTIGAEGLKESSGTYICDDDDQFANQIINLMNDKNRINKMGEENHKIFIENYCEEIVYEDTLYNAINTK